ncbi:MAG: WecB/TagA/CpsF family glycosyltransferase, partial [Acidimicrobiales bacterium]|nr:WecB/TagA/CpsF family glycosyltransferase [Acidimicrobiales bacterium]
MALLDPAVSGRDEVADLFDGPRRLRLFSAPYHALTTDDILDEITFAVTKGEQRVIASQNLHGIHTYLRSPHYRALHERPKTLVHIDGMPLVWAAKARGEQLTGEYRTACIDWIYDVLSLADLYGWSVFHLGSTEAVSAEGVAALQAQYPRVEIGRRNGFFDMEPTGAENRDVVAEINAFGPDILLVGMGMGRQERWILENIDRLDASVVITTGAMMELISGELPIPPRWIARMGFEWLYRLFDNTGAVAGRYLIEPW